MTLKQQTREAPAQDLPAHDNSMSTGPMGDCVSIVVLWNFAGGSAANVRGFHGSGGLGEINMGSLFAGVPDNPATAVHCIFGHLAQQGGDPQRAPVAIQQYVPNATVHYHNRSNATVTRANGVT